MTQTFGRGCVSAVVYAFALLAFTAASAHAQTTAVFLDSQPGDPIGGGNQFTWTPAEREFRPTVNPSRVALALLNEPAPAWEVRFRAPGVTPLTPGVYRQRELGGIGRVTSAPDVHRPSEHGHVMQCVKGRTLRRLRSRNGGRHAATVRGRFRIPLRRRAAAAGRCAVNSTRASLVPFDGVPPSLSLRIDPADNGYVEGVGIDCGAGRTDCDEAFASIPLGQPDCRSAAWIPVRRLVRNGLCRRGHGDHRDHASETMPAGFQP